MSNALLAISVTAGILGLLVVVLGFMPRLDANGKPTRLRSARSSLTRRLTRRQLVSLVIGIAVGLLLWSVTGWPILIAVAPLAAIGIPYLLGNAGEQKNIERLEALETWTRGLSGLTIGGATSLEQTVLASVGSSPEPIRKEVSTLAARLNARWPTRTALRKLADDLADPTADLVVAHLLLAERVRGAGLANALNDLAEIIFEEVKMRRAIEADRAKPRMSARIITIMTVGILVLVPFLGEFVKPYQSTVGQVTLAVWVAIDVVLLLWLKRITKGSETPRVLAEQAAEAAEAVTA